MIGHSVHAVIALDYARRYPEHVRGAVAIGSAPREVPAEAERLWEAKASAERKEILVRQVAAPMRPIGRAPWQYLWAAG